jgi:predicted ThiF/HesA family dinucleotide-utilizing enzyme
MRTGYNSNHGHRGVNFHIQTEDSGRARPHVITHLFHGGTILASEKADYSDRLESPRLEEDVKALMENQHKDMLRRLVGGELDALIGERLGAEVFPSE